MEKLHRIESRVGGQSRTDFSDMDPSAPKKTEASEHADTFEREARAHVERVLALGKMTRFLGESVSFEVGKKGRGFYFDPDKRKINLDPQWFMERKLSPRMIEWAMYHEGRHTIDRHEDRESFDATVAYCIEKARSYQSVMIEKWRNALDLNDEKQKKFFDSLTEEVQLTKTRPEKVSRVVAPLTKVYFSTLFNSLDDIWVNKGIPSAAPMYEEGTEVGKEVTELYRTTLFPHSDYREVSHVEQYAYSLLRTAMVPDEEVVVNDTVQTELSKTHKYLGKDMCAHDIVSKFLIPRPGLDTCHRARLSHIEKYFMESFDTMVLKDIEAWTPKYKEPQRRKDGEPQEGGNQGQPFDDVMERAKEHEIDHLSPEDIDALDGAIDEAEDADKEKERRARMTPEERERERQRNEQGKRARMAATEDGVFNQPKYDEIMRSRRSYDMHTQRVTEHIESLARLWRELVGRGKEIRMIRERFHKRGSLDIKAFINQYSTLLRGEINENYEPKVFEKRVGKVIENITPEEIRVYLNIDLSGSMKGDSQNMNALKDLTVLLNEAFKHLATMVLTEKEHLDDERTFRVHFEVRGYAEKSATLLSGHHGWADEALLMSEIDKSGGGGTNSSTALSGVEDDLRTVNPDDVLSGKIRVLIFDVTDGETKGAEISKRILAGLKKQYNVITNPLYLGTGNDEEDKVGVATMKSIYGEDTERVTVETIVAVLTERLKRELADMAV